MTRRAAVAVAVCLLVAGVPGLAAADAFVTIPEVSVEPSQPAPGETVTVTPTIRNLERSSSVFEVQDVALRDPGSANEHDRVEDLGTVAPGSAITVPLSITFDDTGTKGLRVHVWGVDRGNDERVHLTYPVTTTVSRQHPRVDVQTNDSVAGIETTGTVTVANGLDSDLRNVEVSVAGGENLTVTDGRDVVATLPSGETTRSQFRFRPETAGEHVVETTLSYTTAGGTERTVTQETTVEAEPLDDDVHPQIEVRTNDSVAGVESTGTVTVANGLETDLSNVEVTVTGGEDIAVTDGRSVVANLARGGTTEAAFRFRPETAGEHVVETTLSYTTAGGTDRNVTRETTVTADALEEDVVLDAATVDAEGTDAVRVEVLNRGNAPVERVSLSGTSPNATVRQAFLQRVPEGERRTALLNVSVRDSPAEVAVTADYEVGERTVTRNATATVQSAPGVIELTGVDVSREGERLHVTGSASNLGLTAADSVVVRVADTDRVSPASPNGDYFVGTVPASDFVAFDVYARTGPNASAIPLEVSYLVDGEQRERTVRVDAPDGGGQVQQAGPATDAAGGGGDGGGLLVPAAIGLVVVLGVGLVMVRAWRNSRAGS